MKSQLLLLAFICLGVLTGCLPENEEQAVLTERSYVDLLYALHAEDEEMSREMITPLIKQIGLLREHWYRPRLTLDNDDEFYHIAGAERAFKNAAASIQDGELGIARAQLDRAVFELEASDRASFQELYIAGIYDFMCAWFEVYEAAQYPDFEGNWREFLECSDDVQRSWKMARRIEPDGYLYFDRGVDEYLFKTLHGSLTKHLAAFREAVAAEDPIHVKRNSEEVNTALWDLVLLFGTPIEDYSPKQSL